MATSVNDLKQHLHKFLTDPQSEHEFRVWFALALRDVHESKDPEVESFAHAIQRAFSDTAAGLYSAEQLLTFLTDLAEPRECLIPVLAATIAPALPEQFARLETGSAVLPVGIGQHSYSGFSSVSRKIASSYVSPYVQVDCATEQPPAISANQTTSWGTAVVVAQG